MKKNIIIAVLATIVVGFTALLIYGMSLEESYTNDYIPSSLVQSDIPNDRAIANEFKKSYMDGCDPDGAATAYCQCTYNYLETNYGLAAMAQMGEEYELTNELTSEMWEAATACL
jgi:hypothetical protein